MVNHISMVESIPNYSPDSKLASMKKLFGPQDGFENHVFRVVEVGAFGNTPKHSHDWFHINYVLEGSGKLFLEGVLHELSPGSFAYVPANALHQFINTGESVLKFICIVPEKGHI